MTKYDIDILSTLSFACGTDNLIVRNCFAYVQQIEVPKRDLIARTLETVDKRVSICSGKEYISYRTHCPAMPRLCPACAPSMPRRYPLM